MVIRSDRAQGDSVRNGEIVYRLQFNDYGLASDDTHYTGIEHISVTYKDDGNYPSFTIPLEDLAPCVE